MLYLSPAAAALAVLCAVNLAPVVHADDGLPTAANTNQTEAASADTAEASSGLLLKALDAMGAAAPLNDARINLYGYAEGGYFQDFTAPHASAGPTYIAYNDFKNTAILDKIGLNVERTVDPARKQFDVGFHAELIYGADAAFIHSNGLLDSQTGRYQWDLVQGYVDVALPGLPLRIRVGKFGGLAGFEQLSANIYGAFNDPARGLYTYSYQFLYAEPTTESGVLATYVLNPQWEVDAGFTLGWNQSVADPRSAPDFLGRVAYTPNDRTSVMFVMTEGPEFPAGFGAHQPSGDNHDDWTALDFVLAQKVTGKLMLGLGCDYVEAPHVPGYAGSDLQWGGLAGYTSYALDSRFTLNTRLEWYQDAAGGFSLNAPVSAAYYAATVGVPIKPFPGDKVLANLLVRPEIRYDDADQPVFASGAHQEITFSMDALFTF